MREVDLHYIFRRISQADETPVLIAECVVGGDVSNAEAGCDVAKLPIDRGGPRVETEQAIRYSSPLVRISMFCAL